MSVTAYKTSGTCVNDTGVGTTGWVAPGGGALAGTEVSADDGTTAQNDGGNATTTNYLKCTNFGFTSADVPIGATIDGFEIEIRELRNAGVATVSTILKFVQGGTIQGNDIGNNTDWPTTETPENYGSTTELGGLSWTQSDVTSSNFGIAVAIVAGSIRFFSFPYFEVDQVRLRINYTAGGGGGPARRIIISSS